jgi:hypothetical protein
MMRRILLAGAIAAALVTGGLFSGLFIRPAAAINTSDLLKVGGSLLAVNQLGPQMNHFINELLGQRKAEAAGQTKVVPIVSVGQGAYIGAAQVIGASAGINKTQAVAAVEGVMGKASGTLLVPISTKIPGANLAKVPGVGVSAVLDLKL